MQKFGAQIQSVSLRYSPTLYTALQTMIHRALMFLKSSKNLFHLHCTLGLHGFYLTSI